MDSSVSESVSKAIADPGVSMDMGSDGSALSASVDALLEADISDTTTEETTLPLPTTTTSEKTVVKLEPNRYRRRAEDWLEADMNSSTFEEQMNFVGKVSKLLQQHPIGVLPYKLTEDDSKRVDILLKVLERRKIKRYGIARRGLPKSFNEEFPDFPVHGADRLLHQIDLAYERKEIIRYQRNLLQQEVAAIFPPSASYLLKLCQLSYLDPQMALVFKDWREKQRERPLQLKTRIFDERAVRNIVAINELQVVNDLDDDIGHIFDPVANPTKEMGEPPMGKGGDGDRKPVHGLMPLSKLVQLMKDPSGKVELTAKGKVIGKAKGKVIQKGGVKGSKGSGKTKFKRK